MSTTKAPQLIPVQIDFNTATDHELVAAIPGKTIYVYRFSFKALGAVSVQFKSGATPLSPLIAYNAGEGWSEEFDTEAYFSCAKGEALNVTLSAAQQVVGMLYYKLL